MDNAVALWMFTGSSFHATEGGDGRKCKCDCWENLAMKAGVIRVGVRVDFKSITHDGRNGDSCKGLESEDK